MENRHSLVVEAVYSAAGQRLLLLAPGVGGVDDGDTRRNSSVVPSPTTFVHPDTGRLINDV